MKKQFYFNHASHLNVACLYPLKISEKNVSVSKFLRKYLGLTAVTDFYLVFPL